jgi:hypothetical protein
MQMIKDDKGTGDVIYWFRIQDSDTNKYLFNRLTACYTGSDVIHCELYFCDRNMTVCINSNRSFTIFRGYNREYSERDKWRGYRVTLPKSSVEAMWKHSKKDVGKSFDKMGIICFCAKGCFSTPERTKVLICSKQVTLCSISGGVFDDTLDADKMTPSDVCDVIRELKRKKKFPITIVKNWPLN